MPKCIFFPHPPQARSSRRRASVKYQIHVYPSITRPPSSRADHKKSLYWFRSRFETSATPSGSSLSQLYARANIQEGSRRTIISAGPDTLFDWLRGICTVHDVHSPVSTFNINLATRNAVILVSSPGRQSLKPNAIFTFILGFFSLSYAFSVCPSTPAPQLSTANPPLGFVGDVLGDQHKTNRGRRTALMYKGNMNPRPHTPLSLLVTTL